MVVEVAVGPSIYSRTTKVVVVAPQIRHMISTNHQKARMETVSDRRACNRYELKVEIETLLCNVQILSQGLPDSIHEFPRSTAVDLCHDKSRYKPAEDTSQHGLAARVKKCSA